MGCDIHAHIDIEGDHFALIDIGRDYTLFHAIAGVRHGEVNQVFPLRGLPNKQNISGTTQNNLQEYEDDAHSVSWLTVTELSEVYRRYFEKTKQKNAEVEAVIAAMIVLENDKPGKVVFTFWFDN